MARSYNKNADVIDAFRAGTAYDGMENASGTLSVQESRNGDLNLIGYGWMLYAKYIKSRDHIVAYRGHVDYAQSMYNGSGSSTVSKHFNPERYGGIGGIEHIADEIRPDSPTVAESPESVMDIGSLGVPWYKAQAKESEILAIPDEEEAVQSSEPVQGTLAELFSD